MTDEFMQGLAIEAFNMAKRDIERGKFSFLLATYHGEGRLHRMSKIEATIIRVLGEDWLNNGRAKDAGYGVLRDAVRILPPEAVVMASMIKLFTSTEKFQKLPHREQMEILNGGHDRQWQEVAAGNLAVCDALFVIVQTPTRVCIWKRSIPDGEPQVDLLDQDDLGGRMKMFGAEEGEGSAAWVKRHGETD